MKNSRRMLAESEVAMSFGAIFKDARVQMSVAAMVVVMFFVRLEPRDDDAVLEMIYPPHPVTCEQPNCHSCQVILSEYERLGTPLR